MVHMESVTAQASVVSVCQNSRANRTLLGCFRSPFTKMEFWACLLVFYSATFPQSAFISFVRTVLTTSKHKALVVLLLFTLDLFNLAIAALGSACLSGIYQQLFVLSAYAPAESYCSAHFPPCLLQPSTPLSLEVQSEAMTLQGPYTTRTIV